MQFNDELCARHLAGMVKYPTVSHAESDKMDFEPFYGLHKYLEETYPLVHKHLKREIIGKAALLYTWKGTGKSDKLPLFFAAHQDVVPEGDHAKWNYPPYEGVIADGFVWGRGAADCKSNIMAQLEAAEALLAEGYTPDYDVYFGFGYNEEVGGGDDNSAAAICETLKERGVTLGGLFDEGGGVGPAWGGEKIDCPIGHIRVSEKGYADFVFSIKDKGGHSMAPGKNSIIARLGKLAYDLHNNQFPYRLCETTKNEYIEKCHHVIEHKELFEDLENSMEALAPILDNDPMLASKFRTTMALTMMSGSPQANILPTEASITMNCRILEGDTVESLYEKFKKIAGDDITITVLQGRDPSPVSRIDSDSFLCAKELAEELNPGSIVVPAMTGGGTDARNYYPICDSVYRFNGFVPGSGRGTHNFNECFRVEGCGKGPDFIVRLIKKYGDFKPKANA